MSAYAWIGVVSSAIISTLAVAGYIAMCLPYFDNAPRFQDLKKYRGQAILLGIALFGVFFGLYLLAAMFITEETSGPLLLFGGLITALPASLLLGTETWDRHNAHGMNTVPALRAVAVATSIGLAELIGGTTAFMLVMVII